MGILIRKLIIESIKKIIPFDALEQIEITSNLKWIESGEPIFRTHKPDIPQKHLTVFFAPYDQKAKTVLLGHHKKSNWWIFPGGHVEINETLDDSVKRECLEELGIQANFLIESPFFIASTHTVGTQNEHIDIGIGYLLKCEETTPFNFDKDEFHFVRWFNLEDIPYSQSDPAMERFINKIIALT